MDLLGELVAALGPGHVLTGEDRARYASDWTGKYRGSPLAVVRPADTAEVARVLQLAQATGTKVVPVSGNTGLVGGTMTEGGLMLSLERMNRIRSLNPAARVAVVEAGVVLQKLHDAAEAEGLYFPLWFGARGSAMIGGALSTNAGGSNVLRYGSTRGLCLGLEVVLADGRVLDLMGALHKDNSGYALKDLFIGAEGTLGIITAAVMRLVPRPRAHATAMVALPELGAALDLLNRLQEATGGTVEAFEYMGRNYLERLAARRPDLGLPFATIHDVTILVEVGATAPRDATPGPDGALPVVDALETAIAALMEEGRVLDAVVARSEAQRRAMWARREVAAEVSFDRSPLVDTDVALPLDLVPEFLTRMTARLAALDPGATELAIAHLGDGNVHYTAFPSHGDPAHLDAIRAAVDAEAVALGGSFSAEHGVGLSKRGSMRRHKNRVAVEAMQAVKSAFDPSGILNPGKLLP
ncbi:MAG: FAD-binding oxidoreductase [Gemmobacter sp.]